MSDLRSRARSLHARLFPPLEPPKPRPVVRLTRRNRRVLLVLLSGAPDLSGYPICRAAGVPSGTAYYVLWRLEDAGWVTSEWGPVFTDDGLRRRFYRLTPTGRTGAYALLGLEAPGAPPAMMPAPVAAVLPAGPTPLHAHEITPDDAAFMRMMAGARFGPDATVVLPSGKTITGAEMARWLEAPG